MIQLKKCPVCESNKLNLFMICKDFSVSQQNFNIVSCETCGFKFTNPIVATISSLKLFLHEIKVKQKNKIK